MIVKKASKRLFLLTPYKHARADRTDIVTMITTLVRPLVEYCCVVWHPGLPKYLSDDIESIQKRAVTIALGLGDYDETLESLNLESLNERRHNICLEMFKHVSKPDTFIPWSVQQQRVEYTKYF